MRSFTVHRIYTVALSFYRLIRSLSLLKRPLFLLECFLGGGDRRVGFSLRCVVVVVLVVLVVGFVVVVVTAAAAVHVHSTELI